MYWILPSYEYYFMNSDLVLVLNKVYNVKYIIIGVVYWILDHSTVSSQVQKMQDFFFFMNKKHLDDIEDGNPDNYSCSLNWVRNYEIVLLT